MNFDTQKFIRLIETRGAIWDITTDEYTDRYLKKRKWEEIANSMCDTANLTKEENKELVLSLQQKWKNIRTSFTRELKRRAGVTTGSAAFRKSPYIYFDHLHFLKKIIMKSETRESADEPEVSVETNDESDAPISSQVFKKIKTENDNVVRALKGNISGRAKRERVLSEQASDSDRLFMLSLVEDFKSIPKHRKLSTKMEIIEVIKRAQTEFEHSEFGMFHQDFSAYEPEPSTSESSSRRLSN